MVEYWDIESWRIQKPFERCLWKWYILFRAAWIYRESTAVMSKRIKILLLFFLLFFPPKSRNTVTSRWPVMLNDHSNSTETLGISVQAHTRRPTCTHKTKSKQSFNIIFRSKHAWRQMPDQIQAKFVGWAHQMTGTIWLQKIIMINMCDKYFIELWVDCLRTLSKASACYFCEERTWGWWFTLYSQSDLLDSGGPRRLLY